MMLMTTSVYAEVEVSSGKLDRIQSFPSKYIEPRAVHIWLPQNYDGTQEFSVLYMHDGQMLFDASTTWNKKAWEIDEVAGALIKAKKIRNTIVVGIFNGGDSLRHSEYLPRKVLQSLSLQAQTRLNEKYKPENKQYFAGSVKSDDYLKFLVEELKPYIDKHYKVRVDRKNTFVMGSSMGGLISLYALSEYPHVFGGAACISTHWPGVGEMKNNPLPEAFYRYIKEHLPPPGDYKIYFDYGNATLDAQYPPLQKKVDNMMREKGFTDAQWVTRFFEGAEHSEIAWSKRLHIPLQFLLTEEPH